MVQASSLLSVGGLLVFGTISSILSKVVYQTEGEDFDGHAKFFKKPWMSTALMFASMVFCLPIAWIATAIERSNKKKAASEHEPLLNEESNGGGAAAKLAAHSASFKEVMILAVPMLFDLTATLLMSVGLLYVTASVYQMLRGAEILFSALFAVTFLKRPLNRLHYGGILCCMVGITMVGASSLLGSGDSSSSEAGGSSGVLLGMGLIVFAQAVQAAQVTVEDYAMNRVGLAPLQVVGYEGLLGSIALFGILMPIVYFLPGKDGEGLHEDSLESIHMITHSLPRWSIPAVLAANSGSLLLYNVAGMFVTDQLGAVSRTVFESARTLFVWLGDLLLYYVLPRSTHLGEGWDRSSYLQAAGFAVLVAGTLIYGRGDDRQAHADSAKHDGMTQQASKKTARQPTFKFHHTIAAHHSRSTAQHRWANALNSTLAAARLRSGSQHAGNDAT